MILLTIRAPIHPDKHEDFLALNQTMREQFMAQDQVSEYQVLWDAFTPDMAFIVVSLTDQTGFEAYFESETFQHMLTEIVHMVTTAPQINFYDVAENMLIRI